ncbi:hypothetical protein BW1_005_02560 [Bacillus mycoides NBRC 101238 = DSM 11821]|nr:hypothetical protein BW1_005_02560 [Bacillus mycoides NBRC 101238 = DSM 11821]
MFAYNNTPITIEFFKKILINKFYNIYHLNLTYFLKNSLKNNLDTLFEGMVYELNNLQKYNS